MPFQYEHYRNPFVSTIGDLLIRRGDIEAQRAQTIANAQAQAAQQSGAAWANAIGTIGQTVAAIPGQIQAAKAQAQQSEMNALALEGARRDHKSAVVFEQGLKDPQNYNADGSLNDEAVAQYLKTRDVGAWQQWTTISAANRKNAIETAKAIADLTKTNLDIDEKQRAAQQLRATYLGKLAFRGERLLSEKPEDPLHARDTTLAMVARAAADRMVSEDEAKAFLLQTAGANPTQLQQVFASFVPPDLRAAQEKELAANAKTQAEAAKAQAEADNLKQYGSVTAPNNEWKDVLLDGKPTKVFVNPKTKVVTDLAGTIITNPAARIKPIPPASITIQNDARQALANLPSWATDASRPTGPDANKLDPTVRMTPNGLYQAAQTYIATGQFPPTGRGNDPAAQAVRAAVSSKVGAIAAASGMDEPALRAFYKANAGSLTQQQKAYDAVSGFMAAADKNAALLKESLKKLPDTGSPLFNQSLRAFEEKVKGNPAMAEVATYLRSVKNEYARIVSQPNLAGQLTDSARHEADALLKDSATVQQMLASLEALSNEGNNRLVSISDQIQRIQQRLNGGAKDDGPTPPKANPFR
jgi:hypothetical protein